MRFVTAKKFICVALIATGIYFFSRGSSPINQNDAPHSPSSAGAVVLGVSRAPSSDKEKTRSGKPDIVAQFQDASLRKWFLEWSADQKIIRTMSKGALSYRDKNLEQASKEFLGVYGKSLLGLDSSALALSQFNDKGVLKNIVFDQLIDGIPVYQSRIVLFFDSEMNLVHVNNNSSKADASSPSPKISAIEAAQIVFFHLQKKYSSDEIQNISPTNILSSAKEYFFQNQGALARVYRFVVALPQPVFGDYEWIVDASSGSIVLERNLSRK